MNRYKKQNAFTPLPKRHIRKFVDERDADLKSDGIYGSLRRKAVVTGFTLIELIMVMVILGILYIMPIPLFVDLRQDAREAQELGVSGIVRSGILADHARRLEEGNATLWPTQLDSIAGFPVTCSVANQCFSTVVAQGGIQQDWQKLSATTYRSPLNTTNVWTYTSGDGRFEKTTA